MTMSSSTTPLRSERFASTLRVTPYGKYVPDVKAEEELRMRVRPSPQQLIEEQINRQMKTDANLKDQLRNLYKRKTSQIVTQNKKRVFFDETTAKRWTGTSINLSAAGDIDSKVQVKLSKEFLCKRVRKPVYKTDEMKQEEARLLMKRS